MIKINKLKSKFYKFSIRSIMLLSIVSLIIIVVMVFLATTLLSGLFHNTDALSFKSLQNHSTGKESSISKILNNSSRDAVVYANATSVQFEKYLENTNNLSDTTKLSDIQIDSLLSISMDNIVSYLDKNTASGAFIILDSYYKNPDAFACIYLRDPTPLSQESGVKNFTLLRGPTRLLSKNKYSIEKSWRYEQFFEQQEHKDILNLPQEMALKYPLADRNDWGYWSKPWMLTSDDIQIITFTTPILDSDNNPIGVFGVELSINCLKNIIPNKSLPSDSGFYMMGMKQDDNILTNTTFTANPEGNRFLINFEDKIPLTAVEITNDYKVFKTNSKKDMYTTFAEIEIYSKNSPFKHSPYYFFAFSPKTEVLQGSTDIYRALVFALSISFIFAISGSIFISKLVASKIEILAKDVTQTDMNEPLTIPKSNVKELDMLADVFMKMHEDIINYTARMSKIIDFVGVPMGAFELKNKSNVVYLSESLIRLFCLEEQIAVSNNITIDDFFKIVPTLNLPKQINTSLEQEIEWEYLTFIKCLRISVVNQNGNIYGIVIDITSDVLEKRKIEYERDYDPLTNLLNRNSHIEKMQNLISKYPDKKGILLFSDLDNLKYINDNLGHDTGDCYIQHAAKALKIFDNYESVIARISGDEFVVFIHGYDSHKELKEIVDNTLLNIRDEFIILPDESIQKIRMSVGLSYFPNDSEDLSTLIKYADYAMYEIKHSVKGETKEFDRSSYNKNGFIINKTDLLTRLIDERRIKFVFQPIIDISTGDVFAYEALMRPLIREFKSPLEVLVLAKNQSKLYQIEKMTTTFILEWVNKNKQILDGKKIFINVIANQIMMPNDEKELSELLKDISDSVVMEITENESGDEEKLIQKLQYIRNAGCKVAIDDYGSGYNHEFSLILISPDYLKIDMSIIRGLDKDMNRQRIVKQIVDYSTMNNIKVLAEGVETKEELNMVISLGVHLVQGYYLGKPNPNLNMHDKQRCDEAAEFYAKCYFRQISG